MTSPKIQVHLVSCLMVHHWHAILIYTIRDIDASEHSYRSAHIEWTGHAWEYRTIADMGRSFYLPQTATRADAPIEHTFTSAIDEAIKIAHALGTLI